MRGSLVGTGDGGNLLLVDLHTLARTRGVGQVDGKVPGYRLRQPHRSALEIWIAHVQLWMRDAADPSQNVIARKALGPKDNSARWRIEQSLHQSGVEHGVV